MKILFTGASSFTGCWFVRELARSGHEVVATFRQAPDNYPDPLRRERASTALQHARGVFNCSFGDDRFMRLAQESIWDLVCHHGADVTNYKSEAFDVDAAVSNNTHNLGELCQVLAAQNSLQPAILLTGSVFENNEGAASDADSAGLPAFSPYGRSKHLTYRVFREQTRNAGLRLGKFVIPNPFGPLEEPRFTAYLMKNWFAGKTPAVNTPDYVRDNIHISLLALAYRDFAEQLTTDAPVSRLNPSGYVESQGAFAQRFAAEMRHRLNLKCELKLNTQTDFSEPRERYNTDTLDAAALGWDESKAWDEIARYYSANLQN